MSLVATAETKSQFLLRAAGFFEAVDPVVEAATALGVEVELASSRCFLERTFDQEFPEDEAF
jgi:hypothetical protein